MRFKHTSESGCFLAEIEVTGILLNTQTVSESNDHTCDVKVGMDTTISSAVTYSHDKTALVTSIEPAFGSTSGGTQITITGTNFHTTEN